jgi:glycine/D-amino acid oxidase-like deaminating enzyme
VTAGPDRADVVVVGGGIIGAACADALARTGRSVVLFERDVLAAGASGRNQGLFVAPADPPLVPMADASLDVYRSIARDAPLPIRFDEDAIGFLRVGDSDDDVAELEAEAVAAERFSNVRVDRLSPEDLVRVEPGVAPNLAGGCLFHTGRRVDPTNLTVALGLRAREHGADVREHQPVRAFIEDRDAVLGVVTDGGRTYADAVVVAAGPWAPDLLRTIGVDLPIEAARGWLVLVDAPSPLLSRPVESAGGSWREPPTSVSAGEYVGRDAGVGLGTLVHPSIDGTTMVGSSREPVVGRDPVDAGVPRAILRRAIRYVPRLADARVRSTWWGIRPMSPDDRPMVGVVRDGLVVAGAHGAEGVLLGGGTAALVRSIVADEPVPFDAAPFGPFRFS